MGKVYGFLFTVPHITHLASLSTHTYTYSQSISPSLCLWILALLCSDLTKLLDNTEIHCYISPFPSPASSFVRNLNFTVLSRRHILLQKACSPHRLRLARFAVACREWATRGNTTPLETLQVGVIYMVLNVKGRCYCKCKICKRTVNVNLDLCLLQCREIGLGFWLKLITSLRCTVHRA